MIQTKCRTAMIGFVLAIAAAGDASAQATQPSTAEVDAKVQLLADFANRNRIAGFVDGTSIAKIESVAAVPSHCILSLASQMTSGIGSRPQSVASTTSVLPLSKLSPTAAPTPRSAIDGVQSVLVYTSSGDSSISTTLIRDGTARDASLVHLVDFTVESRTLADSFVLLLNGAIRMCGGTSATAETIERITAAQPDTSKELANPFGTSLAPGVRAAVLKSCRDQIRNRYSLLIDPVFDVTEEPSLRMPYKNGELWVHGTVEYRKRSGDTGELAYICSIRKVGSKYIAFGGFVR